MSLCLVASLFSFCLSLDVFGPEVSQEYCRDLRVKTLGWKDKGSGSLFKYLLRLNNEL